MELNREHLISVLKGYFEQKAHIYNIEMAFLYGSWAFGHVKAESDVDAAVLLHDSNEEDKIFELLTTVSLELTELLMTETNVLYIDWDLSRPMLYYNAIVHGIPVFIRDFTNYVDLRLRAIRQMEDFFAPGYKWQVEVTKKRLRALKDARI